jgi:hypothetical protein
MNEKPLFDMNARRNYINCRRMISLFQRTEEEWSEGIYNSPIDRYDIWFKQILQGRKIEDLISGIDSPVVIDLMSSPRALRDLLPEKDGLGISVSLGDLRTSDEIKKDELINLFHIVGQIENSSTWSKIQDKLNGRKVNLVIELAQSGQENIPMDRIFFLQTLRRIWRILDTEGYAVLQVPPTYQMEKIGVSLPTVVNSLNKNGVAASLNNGPYWSLLFQKPLNSTYNIPILSD